MDGKRARRWLTYGVWVAAALWIVKTTVLPAPVRATRLTEVSGFGPYYAGLSWSYGLGARPVSIIFDLEAGSAKGSITTDGEAFEAEIPLGVFPRGPYSLTVSATYRVLGFAHTVVTRVGDVA
ncbi:MAG: hypothetical protein HGA45_43380 [Chloroflexales bacterium]|nr:hypothetical protein [Chloroflexales bacterium]